MEVVTGMERIYKSMKKVGAGNNVSGVIIMVVGITIGIISIISGARLLKNKADITF